ncbi:hypothetical protein [Couchioplanes azureus]|uniref:hypothetical protein n=1 Tax=Couchioplanes caeruleus TaxID=56438 RepID=UPI00166FBCBC|nr:hypothetical protein [Couchioplanes caeruleus]GGQ70266.1 hypothetical protein GCM10010166_45170 [Couchioplanes caeruleus subsp. azureus]
MSDICGRIDEIDVQMERIRRLIDHGARQDPELGAGLGTTEDLTGIQRRIDRALVASEGVDRAYRDLLRQNAA